MFPRIVHLLPNGRATNHMFEQSVDISFGVNNKPNSRIGQLEMSFE